MYRYVNDGTEHGDVADVLLFTSAIEIEEAPAETEAPETAAPETEAPETAAPETEAPETEAPETEAPETAAPETEAPETSAPETEAPAAEGGCGSFIGGGLVVITAILGTAWISKRK